MKGVYAAAGIIITVIIIGGAAYFTTRPPPEEAEEASVVSMKNNAFNPSTITIHHDGSVTWTNNDGYAHNITWTSVPENATVDNSRNFSSGSWTWTFEVEGTYQYECTIHAGMTGQVTVEEHAH